ncbi:hypothetical protein Gohar_027308, partial [Gossypium harknessii]|nr:hypothetical protein [Gossypium harknessii]
YRILPVELGVLPIQLWVLPIQRRLLSVEHTPVRKVVLAWAFYRYPSLFYRYNQRLILID